MVAHSDDVVGNVAQALRDANLWERTIMVWSSDNGAAVELTTGMKNSFPLRGGCESATHSLFYRALRAI